MGDVLPGAAMTKLRKLADRRRTSRTAGIRGWQAGPFRGTWARVLPASPSLWAPDNPGSVAAPPPSHALPGGSVSQFVPLLSTPVAGCRAAPSRGGSLMLTACEAPFPVKSQPQVWGLQHFFLGTQFLP